MMGCKKKILLKFMVEKELIIINLFRCKIIVVYFFLFIREYFWENGCVSDIIVFNFRVV